MLNPQEVCAAFALVLVQFQKMNLSHSCRPLVDPSLAFITRVCTSTLFVSIPDGLTILAIWMVAGSRKFRAFWDTAKSELVNFAMQ